jgi:hypothetical protein
MTLHQEHPAEDDAGRRIKLGELKRVGGRTGVSLNVLAGFNLNNRTLTVTMPMETFREVSDVANEARIIETGGDRSLVAQRPLDPKHAKALALYMLRGMVAGVRRVWSDEGRPIPEDLEDILVDLGAGPYQGLQPLTGNIRQCAPEGADLDIKISPDGQLILYLRLGQMIYVIDGQHRRFAYELLVAWLREILQAGKYLKRGLWMPQREDLGLTADEIAIWSAVIELARSHFTVDVTVHLGLTPEQERQLFHDLNNLGKKPDPALAQAFDHANPVSVFIRKSIEEKDLLGGVRIADKGSKKGGKSSDVSTPTIYRDDLATANSLLFAGATNQTSVAPADVNDHTPYGERFWEVVVSQPHFGVEDWQKLTLLAEPVMIKALATLAFTFHGSREKNHALRDQFLTALADGKVDFSPANPLWALYLKDDAQREAEDPALTDYLTPDIARKTYAVVRDGRYDFAANTRDIARYLGDLIRWKLKLPPRPGLATLKAKLAAQAASEPAKAA